MQAAPLLLDTLDELGADEFKRFRWNLSQPVLAGCQPIRKGYLENADRQDTVSKMIDSYSEEAAVNLTAEILRRMNHNNAAEKLRRAFSGGSTALQTSPPPSASSSYPPGSVFVSPNIQGTSAGTINLNINTNK
ncbi:pyrin domain-containing protein 1-like [Halichoeres trimaculatus]|uniref:pyrin domain-containing protein 1-like n=1 Tax=Halichoeres trimaculatus TaxID=147232 RepID=UPI003D9F2D8C